MHTLVTFLGRTDRSDNRYPPITYTFPNGTSETAAFVGYSLMRHERAGRLVIMGTAGSAWDQLVDGDLFRDPEDVLSHELAYAVDTGEATQEQIDELARPLSEALDVEVIPRLVPPAFDTDDQVDLLHKLAEATHGSDSLSLDVTHGFRHMPMLVVFAALYLRQLRPSLSLHHLWYASANLGARTGRVNDVDGILHMADWLLAMQRSELTGDYREIAELMGDSQLAKDLTQGGFLENVHQGQQARTQLRRVREGLKNEPLAGAGALFQPVLMERTAWVARDLLYKRQRDHALKTLERGDFLRAALYGYEAFLTRLVYEEAFDQSDPNNQDVRKQAEELYRERLRQRPRDNAEARAYRILNDLRNVLAHGNRADRGEIRSALESPDRLQETLKWAIDELLPES